MTLPALAYNSDTPASENRVIITSDYMKQNQARAVPGAIPYREDGKFKAWVVDDPTPRAAAVLCRLFPEVLDAYGWLADLRDSLLRDARPFDNATPLGLSVKGVSPEVRSVLSGEGHDFYDFQDLDLGYLAAVLAKHRAAYVAWERGLGKTLAACSLIEARAAEQVLVVCPNTAKDSVWQAEGFARFLPAHETFIMPNGKPEKRSKMIEELAARHEPYVLITHYEALNLVREYRSKSAKRGWDRFGTFDLVVCDEAHRLSNTGTKMHRALMTIKTLEKVALSGSMIQNHPEEIFGVLRWLFPTVYKSLWRDWNNRFLEYVESGYGKVLVGPKADKVDDMRKELGVFTVYRRKADELDLPDKTEQTLRVDLSPKQRAAYVELRDSLVTTLDSGEQIVALQPITLLGKLRQVATGLELVSGEVADSAKLDLAVELVRDNPDDPFVIFSWFKRAAEAIAARLADEGAYLVTGDTTHKQRTDTIRKFQRGGGRVFVGTISTLGESVNLQRATQAIFLDRSWNPAQNEQAADRIYRIGQDQPVTITYIVAKDTVDEYNVLPALNNKEQIRRMILGGL